MQAKSMEELDAAQHHFLSFGAVGIVLVIKANIVLVDTKDTPGCPCVQGLHQKQLRRWRARWPFFSRSHNDWFNSETKMIKY